MWLLVRTVHSARRAFLVRSTPHVCTFRLSKLSRQFVSEIDFISRSSSRLYVAATTSSEQPWGLAEIYLHVARCLVLKYLGRKTPCQPATAPSMPSRVSCFFLPLQIPGPHALAHRERCCTIPTHLLCTDGPGTSALRPWHPREQSKLVLLLVGTQHHHVH